MARAKRKRKTQRRLEHDAVVERIGRAGAKAMEIDKRQVKHLVELDRTEALRSIQREGYAEGRKRDAEKRAREEWRVPRANTTWGLRGCQELNVSQSWKRGFWIMIRDNRQKDEELAEELEAWLFKTKSNTLSRKFCKGFKKLTGKVI